MNSPTSSQVYVFFLRGQKVFKGSLRAFLVDQKSYGGKVDGFASDEDFFERSPLCKNYKRLKTYTTFNFSLNGEVRARDASIKTFLNSWALGLPEKLTFRREGEKVKVTKEGADAGTYDSWGDVFVEFCKPKGFKMGMAFYGVYRDGKLTHSDTDVPASYPWCIGYAEEKEKFDALEFNVELASAELKAELDATKPRVEPRPEVSEVDFEEVEKSLIYPPVPLPDAEKAVNTPPSSVAAAVLDVLKLHLANDPVALRLLEVYQLASK